MSLATKPSESRTTAMRMMGVRTVRVLTPVMAPAVARTCVLPSPTPVATPAVLTEAIALAWLLQLIVGCTPSATPSPSTACAVNDRDAPR